MFLARIGVIGSTLSDYQWCESRAAAWAWIHERCVEDPRLCRLPASILTEDEANARRWQHGGGTSRFYPSPV